MLAPGWDWQRIPEMALGSAEIATGGWSVPVYARIRLYGQLIARSCSPRM